MTANTVEVVDQSTSVIATPVITTVVPTTLDVNVTTPDETVTLTLELLEATVIASSEVVTVAVDSPVTNIVSVGVQGPQGPGLQHNPLTTFIVDSTIVQEIPLHDGTASTEITILFGPDTDGAIDVTNGIMTTLKDVTGFSSNLEVHANGIGPGGQRMELAMWAEVSIDNGVTWNVVPGTNHANDVRDAESNSHSISVSEDQDVPAGVKFRLQVTKLGDANTTLLVTAPPDLTTSNGVVSGDAAHAVMFYRESYP